MIGLPRGGLTSYAKLELSRPPLPVIGLTQRLRRSLREHQLGGDYGGTRLMLLILLANKGGFWRAVDSRPLRKAVRLRIDFAGTLLV